MMKRRQMHITICLSALLIASVGTVFLNQPSAPMRIPQSQTPGFSSGAASSNGYHAAMDLNQPPTGETPNGAGTQRTTILLPEERAGQRVTLNAADFEQRKPSPPPGLSVNENTKSAVQNLPPRDGDTDPADPFDEGPEDLIPPNTDVPVQLPNEPDSKPNPDDGDPSIPEDPSGPDSSSDTGSAPESGDPQPGSSDPDGGPGVSPSSGSEIDTTASSDNDQEDDAAAPNDAESELDCL